MEIMALHEAALDRAVELVARLVPTSLTSRHPAPTGTWRCRPPRAGNRRSAGEAWAAPEREAAAGDILGDPAAATARRVRR